MVGLAVISVRGGGAGVGSRGGVGVVRIAVFSLRGGCVGVMRFVVFSLRGGRVVVMGLAVL
jgi:hypothetical protein